jgi:periplasmic protein TonB
MEPKKSKKADLERNRGLFFGAGLVVVLVLVLFAFEWKSVPYEEPVRRMMTEPVYETEEMQITRREQPRAIPVQQEQKISEVLNVVANDALSEEKTDFDVEANSETEISFPGIPGEEVEYFNEDDVYTFVEEMPTFNGGDPAIEFRKYIFRNLHYPEIASKNGISGRVVIQFTVNALGKVTDAVVIVPLDPALDKEALRVVLDSPAWTPGKQRGRAVKVQYTFPINFVLR